MFVYLFVCLFVCLFVRPHVRKREVAKYSETSVQCSIASAASEAVRWGTTEPVRWGTTEPVMWGTTGQRGKAPGSLFLHGQ